jgi:hypothetical protein
MVRSRLEDGVHLLLHRGAGMAAWLNDQRAVNEALRSWELPMVMVVAQTLEVQISPCE